MAKRGPIKFRDANQNKYSADFVPVEKKFYPYRNSVSILDGWFQAHPKERPLKDKLTISGLSSPLKTEKRAHLARKLSDITDVRMDTELRIGREGESGSKQRES